MTLRCERPIGPGAVGEPVAKLVYGERRRRHDRRRPQRQRQP